MAKPTLVLDLDGTLIRNDLTLELLVLCARWNPVLLIQCLLTALRSLSHVKRQLTDRFAHYIDPATLPYEPEVLRLMETHRQQGHPVELVSGADEALVRKIAAYHGIDDFKGSTPGTNLTSHRKAKFLSERHGRNFSYVGNSRADFAVWNASQTGFGINAPEQSFKLTRDDGTRVQVEKLVDRRSEKGALWQALRPHQWAKNLLLFVVPALHMTQLSVADGVDLALAFFAFSGLASATYLLNDLFDIQDDRLHPTKRDRPLASGRLSVVTAIVVMLILGAASLALAFWIAPVFGLCLLIYATVTCLYSMHLKRQLVVDVFTLAGLFSIRVIAGAFLVGAPPTGWLMTFIGCFFLSLAIGKRYIEIQRLGARDQIAGRSYRRRDEIPMLTFGAAIGAASILAMLIYGLSSPSSVFSSENVVLLGAALLMLWLLRFWLLAGRGDVHDDPVIFALRDKTSLGLICLTAGLFAFDLSGGHAWWPPL